MLAIQRIAAYDMPMRAERPCDRQRGKTVLDGRSFLGRPI